MNAGRVLAASSIVVMAATSDSFVGAQQGRAAASVVAKAAEALGGTARLRAVKTISVAGYGENAYYNGGGNISASPDAPQKWVRIPEYEKTIDLEHGRMRVRQRNHNNFVFAGLAGYLGAPTPAVTSLDGTMAYNTAPDGRRARVSDQLARARRLDMLNNPVALIRVALDPSTRVGNLRTEGPLQLADITVATGETLTLAIAAVSGLPSWVRWMAHDENLGDVTFRTTFTGYLPVKGVMLPMGYTTVMDFRNVVQNKLYVDKNAVDEPIDDLSAPSEVRSAAPPTAPAPSAEATRVSQGVWLLHGTGGANAILFEFADHLTMFEAPTSQGWAKTLIALARATVPGKPLTELVVSHHHFDHTGGIRQAIAEGLTIMAHKGTEPLFREIALRRGTIAPDALGPNPRPLKFKAVDDHLRLADATMQVDLYHVVSSSHMAEALFAHVPKDRLLVQGDFFDVSWDLYWWQKTYADNVAYRRLQVDTDVPVHGRVLPIRQVMQDIERMTKATEDVCSRVRAVGVFTPGCPVKSPAGILDSTAGK